MSFIDTIITGFLIGVGVGVVVIIFAYSYYFPKSNSLTQSSDKKKKEKTKTKEDEEDKEMKKIVKENSEKKNNKKDKSLTSVYIGLGIFLIFIIVIAILSQTTEIEKEKEQVDEDLNTIFEKMNNPAYGSSDNRKEIWERKYEGKYARGCVYVDEWDKTGMFNTAGDYVILADREPRYPHKIVVEFSLFLDDSEEDLIKLLDKNDYICVEGQLHDWMYLTKTVYLKNVIIKSRKT